MALQASRLILLCFFFFFLHLDQTHSLSSTPPTCQNAECTYLLEFLKSFESSWEIEGDGCDCCSEPEIVRCDAVNGHIIGLNLMDTGLFGSFDSNSSLFRLIHLRSLDLSFNSFNYSKIPDSISKFRFLKELKLRGSQFSGPIPSSIVNLTQLRSLDLSNNEFRGKSFSSLSWIARMPLLWELDLSNNGLVGEFPSFITNMTQLRSLDVSRNNLHGDVGIGAFYKFRDLFSLDLSFNNLSFLAEDSVHVTLPWLQVLELSSCKLTSFPGFLRNQENLSWLDLSSNNISGEIPKWFMNIGTKSLGYLNLFKNFLTGFEDKSNVPLPWTSLAYLNLGSNILQGSLPIPPSSPDLWFYSVSGNKLSGPISTFFCNMSSSDRIVLDFSSNYLGGNIPQCLDSLMNGLEVLNLRNNSFVGQIPELWEKNCKKMEAIDFSFNELHGKIPKSLANCKQLVFIVLRHNHISGHIPTWFGSLRRLATVDLSENRLQGHLPKSLASCMKLEHLSLGNNQIEDKFPYWLGNLPELKVLLLKSNKFHGLVRSTEANLLFQRLHILDISNNTFIGHLPVELIKHLNAMKEAAETQQTYMGNLSLSVLNVHFTVGMSHKDNKIEYWKVPTRLVLLDLSRNRFIGEIPETLGDLQRLLGLNLSRNMLTGKIPSTLGNLSEIESLDLSYNKLTGKIPHELTYLNYLAILHLSHNQLIGPIPKGKQFNTFNDSSYSDNVGLCGAPLSKTCVTEALSAEQHSESTTTIDWKIVSMGYATGLVIGLSIGYAFTVWKHAWFVKIVGKRRVKKRRQRMRRSNH